LSVGALGDAEHERRGRARHRRDRERSAPGPRAAYSSSNSSESLGVALGEPAAEAAQDELDDPAEGDKLGGWPAYIQQPSLGDSARCGQPRALLLQVASQGNLAVHFGDGGRLFVAACRDHPRAVEARIEFH
jgi:hypothetical protein